MKARITHLKAPWPSGALVGSVVAFAAGAIPAWATGKCVTVGDEEEAEYLIEPAPPEVADGVNRPLMETAEDQAARMVNHFRTQALDAIKRAEESHALAMADLQAENGRAEAKAADLRARLEASEAHASSLQAKLDAAESDDGKAAAALKDADAQADAERTAAESKAGKGKK